MLAEPATTHQLWSVFTAKAELVGAAVLRATGQTGALKLLHETGIERVAHTTSVAERFPDVAAQAGAGVQDAREVPPDVLALGRSPDADRAACFLAERVWLLVPSDAIVPTLDDGLQRIRTLIEGGAHHPQLVTGPSRTADIERVLTIGVHGPRALMVLVIEPGA
jgi:L-lactate dehydrogenase complex protein LldG